MIRPCYAGTAKVHNARRGRLPPEEMSPYLRHLRPIWDISLFRPILSFWLFALYWTLAISDCMVRLLWTALHTFYLFYFIPSTIWRIETVVPIRPGPRKAVFAMSKPLKMSDVKTIQKSFSGSKPGISQTESLGHAHATVNDVLCAIMADVISLAVNRKKEPDSLRWLKSVANFISPLPVIFFMWVDLALILMDPLAFDLAELLASRPISLRDPGQWDMRNLSTGCPAYLSHLPQARPSIKQIHEHIHKCKTSLNFLKRSYLPVWGFHLLQCVAQFPWIFYPIWSHGIFSQWPCTALKEAIFGTIVTSSMVSFGIS